MLIRDLELDVVCGRRKLVHQELDVLEAVRGDEDADQTTRGTVDRRCDSDDVCVPHSLRLVRLRHVRAAAQGHTLQAPHAAWDRFADHGGGRGGAHLHVLPDQSSGRTPSQRRAQAA